MGIARPLLLVLFVAQLTSSVSARMARSSTYSFDYVVASAGGADQSSAAYSMTAIVQTEGSEGNRSASADYAVTTVLDARGTATSSIADWSLY